jgi:NADH:ubiquinone oxidoreductase subunit 6 (subunit J)
MSQKIYSLAVGLIFLLIAVMHGLRLAFRWEVVLNGWSVPMWVSIVAIAIAAYLAFESLKLGRKS